MNEAIKAAEALRDAHAFDWDEVDSWRVATAIWEACDTARAEERERCARIAELGEALAEESITIAAAIRAPENIGFSEERTS